MHSTKIKHLALVDCASLPDLFFFFLESLRKVFVMCGSHRRLAAGKVTCVESHVLTVSVWPVPRHSRILAHSQDVHCILTGNWELSYKWVRTWTIVCVGWAIKGPNCPVWGNPSSPRDGLDRVQHWCDPECKKMVAIKDGREITVRTTVVEPLTGNSISPKCRKADDGALDLLWVYFLMQVFLGQSCNLLPLPLKTPLAVILAV